MEMRIIYLERFVRPVDMKIILPGEVYEARGMKIILPREVRRVRGYEVAGGGHFLPLPGGQEEDWPPLLPLQVEEVGGEDSCIMDLLTQTLH